MLHATTRGSAYPHLGLSKLDASAVAFFDTKMVGDIMQHIGDYNRIQTFHDRLLLQHRHSHPCRS